MEEHAGSEEQTSTRSDSQVVDPTLRAKYLDYCSGRLSQVFLSLSDERIYDLVEEAAEDAGVNVADLDFGQMMKLATEKLRRSVPLPDLDTWVEEYRERPERYEPYLLGLREGIAEDLEDGPLVPPGPESPPQDPGGEDASEADAS